MSPMRCGRREEHTAKDQARESLARRDQTEERLLRIRTGLGDLLFRGMQLAARCGFADQPTTDAEADKWEADLRRFISANMEGSYIPRLMALPPGPPIQINPALPLERQANCFALLTITTNLSSFIKEYQTCNGS